MTRKKRRGFTFIELAVALACILVLAALVTPAISDARERARRSHCRNNLMQIGLGIHNYHETFGVLPPGWIADSWDPNARMGFGWQVLILPWMEQHNLHQRISFRQGLPAPNRMLTQTIEVYRCPSDASPDVNPLRSDYGTSNYSGNYGAYSERYEKSPALTHWLSPRRARNWPGESGARRDPNGLFYCNSNIRFSRIGDGMSNTICIGERSARSGAGIWVGVVSNSLHNDAVTDCSRGNKLNTRETAFSSEHADGANFMLCDGSVKFISNTIDEKVYVHLSTRNGQEVIDDF